MAWKMSIDLSRPMVPTMGHHDPLEGYVTAMQLAHSAAARGDAVPERLQAAAEAYAALMRGRNWATEDPLGLGGLLIDACRVEQLQRVGARLLPGLLVQLLSDALDGITQMLPRFRPDAPADRRLAFRECGFAIGLAAVERVQHVLDAAGGAPDRDAAKLANALARFMPLRSSIEQFWLDPAHRSTASWTAHREINEVMLASVLVPEGVLALPRPVRQASPVAGGLRGTG